MVLVKPVYVAAYTGFFLVDHIVSFIDFCKV